MGLDEINISFETVTMLFVAVLVGMIVGLALVLGQSKRRKQMRDYMLEYSEGYNILKLNRKLIEKNKYLSSENRKLKYDISICRKAMVSFAEGEKQRKEMQVELDEMRKFQTWQFGRIFEILSKNGVKLSDDEWNELTP